jgi:hypothetical protein
LVTDLLNPIINLWESFAEIAPRLLVALILLAVGYLIGFVIGHAVRIILQKIGVDRQVEKSKLTKAIGQAHISSLIGEITKWYIFIIFLQSAVDVLSLGTLSVILSQFALWLPNVIAAVLILIFGLLFAQYINVKMQEYSKIKGSSLWGTVLKWAIIIIVVVIALGQIGIEVALLEQVILIVLGAFALGAALAIGLSFGLGSKGEASSIIKKLNKKF